MKKESVGLGFSFGFGIFLLYEMVDSVVVNMFKPISDEKRENVEQQSIAIAPLVIYIGGEALVIAGVVGLKTQYGLLFLILGAIIFGLGSLLTYLPARNEYARKKEFKKKITRIRIEDLKMHLDTLRLNIDTNKIGITKNWSLESQYWSILSHIESAILEIESELSKEKK